MKLLFTSTLAAVWLCLLGNVSPIKAGDELSSAVLEAPVEQEGRASDSAEIETNQGKTEPPKPRIESHVVKINITQRRPDFFRPWTKASPSKSSGSGVVISGSRILTNAHVVMYASQILVQLQQGGDQLSAKVVAIAPGMDLAIIELLDLSALEDLPGLEIGDDLAEVKSRITAYGYPTGGDDLSVTDGIVSRIEFTGFYHGAMGARIQVDAALNPGNSGGPAIQDGKIAGLVFSKIQEADNIGYLIPPEEIRAFLADVEDGTYHGKPLLLDQLQTAENPAFRAFLKLEKDETGIAVKTPYDDSENSVLQPWDVITHVGEHKVDNQGYVEVRDGLRLRFLYYVPKLAISDPSFPNDPSRGLVPLTLIRDGEPLDVKVPVQADRDLVVPLLKEHYPEYFIYGPLVFTAATQEYVRAIGGRGMSALISLENPLIHRLTERPSEPGEQIVMMATRMFPHQITTGYDNRPLGVITSLNGKKIRNLRHLAESIQASTDDFLNFEIAGRSESLVFRREEIAATTEEILVDEGIRYQASKSLRDVWEDDE